jgi:hypothetical protein
MALAVLLACIAGFAGCARTPKVLTNEEAYKRFVGTWVNTEYPGTAERPQVFIIRPDYVAEEKPRPDSTNISGKSTMTLKKSWTDEKGYTYCQWFWDYVDAPPDWAGVALTRVDKAGKVLEQLALPGRPEDTADYPEEIIPGANAYFIFYRTK